MTTGASPSTGGGWRRCRWSRAWGSRCRRGPTVLALGLRPRWSPCWRIPRRVIWRRSSRGSDATARGPGCGSANGWSVSSARRVPATTAPPHPAGATCAALLRSKCQVPRRMSSDLSLRRRARAGSRKRAARASSWRHRARASRCPAGCRCADRGWRYGGRSASAVWGWCAPPSRSPKHWPWKWATCAPPARPRSTGACACGRSAGSAPSSSVRRPLQPPRTWANPPCAQLWPAGGSASSGGPTARRPCVDASAGCTAYSATRGPT